MLPLDLDQNEILRYLNMPPDSAKQGFSEMIEECKALLFSRLRPRYIHRSFGMSVSADGVRLEPSGFLLPGKDITNHLQGAKRVIVMALTLGIEAELVVNSYARGEMTRALICEAICTEIIEQYAGKAVEEIIAQEKLTQWMPNFRYGVGYGDLPLSLQPQVLALLDAQRKIGLTVDTRHIMMPRKSITAIFGLFTEEREPVAACDICLQRENCQKRKDGYPCEYHQRDKQSSTPV